MKKKTKPKNKGGSLKGNHVVVHVDALPPPPKKKRKKKPKNKGGRPTKYTKKLAANLVKWITVGADTEMACDIEGISKDTFYRWSGSPPEFKDGKFPEFSDAIKKAFSSRQVRWIMQVDEAGSKNWQARAWLLERIHPEKYSLHIKQKQEGVVKHVFTGKAKNIKELARILSDDGGDSRSVKKNKKKKR